MTKIGNYSIGIGHPVFIIAEISCNHQGDFYQAKELVKAAARAGADAVKLQTYTASTMTLDSPQPWFQAAGNWKGRTLYKLYEEASTPWNWFPQLSALAAEYGLETFSTPFDESAVDFLEEFNPPCYKIASYEFNFIPFLEKVAKTGRPIIASTGLDSLEEVTYSIQTLRNFGAKDLILLFCLTSYDSASPSATANLATMLDLKERFNVEIGLSENAGGTDIARAAAILGASIIEKHLVLQHNPFILDDAFSLDELEFKSMVDNIRSDEKLLPSDRSRLASKIKNGPLFGQIIYGPKNDTEKQFAGFRRVIIAIKNIKTGELLTQGNIRGLRTANAPGLATRYFFDLLGKTAKCDISRGDPLTFSLIN
ncbi:MAG: N-acetylneuraminate synthase family protein [Candidatus Paceibacterota bacterium]